MNIVWVNNGVPVRDSSSLSNDPMYGVDSDIMESISFGHGTDSEHTFIIPEDGEEDYPGLLDTLQAFVPTVENNPDISIMGDYWPDDVGIGNGYDVYYLEYKGLHIYWLMNEE